MVNVQENHRNKSDKFNNDVNQNIKEVLRWGLFDFKSESYLASENLGKSEIKQTFAKNERSQDGQIKLEKIAQFLLQKIEDQNGMANKVLKNTLKGKYNEDITESDINGITESDINGITELYTVAFYLYINSASDNEKKEITEIIEHLIDNFDDPNISVYDYEIDGLKVACFLADLCTKAIETYGLGDYFRTKYKEALKKPKSPSLKINEKNAKSVIPK